MKTKKSFLWLAFLILATIWILVRHNQQGGYYSVKGLVFGTVYKITYQHDGDLKPEIEAELKRFDQSLSPFNDSSVISRVNRNEELVTDSFFQKCFHRSMEISRETKGAFDITVAPLANAWGFGFKKGAFPDSLMIDSLLQITGYKKVKMDNGKVIKQDPRTMLSCSAVAKGYSVDVIAATANSGYTAFPASFSNVIGVKAKDTFNIDAEGLRDKGVDFAAPSEHKIWFGGNDITLQKSNSYAAPYVTAMAGRLMMEQSWINNVWQIKKHLYQKFRGKCVQYIPDWIEKGWIAGKVLKSKEEVYFEVAAKEEADTVILYDKNEFNEYREKHIVYLGNEIAEQPDTQCFFWSRRNRKEQILCSRIKKENINIPVILLKSGKEQDQIWWLTELRKSFEAEGYNAYAISTEQESVLYDLEYIPFAVDENISNKIGDFLYWQTYYNQSDLIICGIQEKESIGVEADIFVRIENGKKQTGIQIYCDKIKKTQMCFGTLGEQQIKKVYDCLLTILTEDEDEE